MSSNRGTAAGADAAVPCGPAGAGSGGWGESAEQPAHARAAVKRESPATIGSPANLGSRMSDLRVLNDCSRGARLGAAGAGARSALDPPALVQQARPVAVAVDHAEEAE